MADLIKFPDTRSRSAVPYRLHRFAPDGSVDGTVLILARDDIEARRHAGELAGGLRAELWSSGRLVDHVAPADHPVATSIRLL